MKRKKHTILPSRKNKAIELLCLNNYIKNLQTVYLPLTLFMKNIKIWMQLIFKLKNQNTLEKNLKINKNLIETNK